MGASTDLASGIHSNSSTLLPNVTNTELERGLTVYLSMCLLRLIVCFQQAMPIFAQSLSVAFLRRPDGSIEPNVSLSGPMQEVQGVINELHKLSSCNKVATAHLLESCSSLPDPSDPRSADMILDKPKRIYVARLALCEISEASGVKWPRGCLGLDLAHGNDAISEDSIDHCVNDLYFASTSNMWTSYSSAKKHAAGICQSVRSGIELDEQVRTFQTLFNATAMVSQELNDSKEQMRAIHDAFSLLRLGLFEFLADVRTQYDEMITSGQSNWQEVEIRTQSVISGLQNVLYQLQQVSESLARHGSQVQSLDTQVQNAHSADLERMKEYSETAQAHIIFTVQVALESIGEISSRTIKDLEAARGISSDLTSTLAQHLSQLGNAAKAVENFSADIDTLRMSIFRTRLEQESTLVEFQASLNKTMSLLQHVTTFSPLLSGLSFPYRVLDVNIPLFTSISLFIFALLSGRFRIPGVASFAAAIALSIFLRYLAIRWDHDMIPRFTKVTVSERIIWGSAMITLFLIPSVRRWYAVAISNFWRLLQYGEATAEGSTIGSLMSNRAGLTARQWVI